MPNKILILGKGFIGERLQSALNCEISDQKIYSLDVATALLAKYQPKILINCIGRTGERNVDDCEIDPDKTLVSNTFVPLVLAEAAIRNNVKLVHLSSGCIYHFHLGKDKPLDEKKIPDFFDLYYSRTKIYAEMALEAMSKSYKILTVRIRIPLDDRPHPKNILSKLTKFNKIIDIPNSVSYIPDFISALKHLIKINACGIYNLVNKGPLRYPELLDMYKKYRPNFQYKILPYRQFKLTRTNVILSTRKLENTGFKVRRIKDVLEECVSNYVKYL